MGTHDSCESVLLNESNETMWLWNKELFSKRFKCNSCLFSILIMMYSWLEYICLLMSIINRVGGELQF